MLPVAAATVRRAQSTPLAPLAAVNIIILDDYQDAVRKLKCADKMEALHAKVFTNTVKGIGQLSVRLRDAEVLVLIRERSQLPRQLLEKLPRLRLISQTGPVGTHWAFNTNFPALCPFHTGAATPRRASTPRSATRTTSSKMWTPM